LDFWRSTSIHPAPVVVLIHGGGWVDGDKSGYRGAVKRYLDAGVSVVAINYRFVSEAERNGVTPPVAARALASDPAQAFEWHDLRLVRMMKSNFETDRDALLAHLLALAEQVGSDGLMFRALLRAAESAAQARRFLDCERHVLRALREFQPPDPRRHLVAFDIAAFAAGHLGRAEDALARFLEQLEVAERSEPSRVAPVAASAASAAVDLDRLEQAMTLRERALRALTVIPETEAIMRAHALEYCSFVTRAVGDRAASLEEGGQALSIARRLRNSLMEQMVLANMCETLVDDGQHEAAGAAYASFTTTIADADAPAPRYMVAMVGVPLHLLRGEIGAAIEGARTAIAAADAIGEDADRRDARLLCADALAHIGASGEALRLADEAAALAPSLPPGRVLLPVENLRAAVELTRDPGGAAARLRHALAAPLADRLLHPHVGAARVLVGRCELAAGRPDAARDAVRGLRYSLALESAALAVRLGADALERRDDPPLRAEAVALIDTGRVPPLHALDLMRAAASRERKRDAAGWRQRMQATAQALADSLRGMPALQAAFIRKHRDLLT
jgi:hypothetical protein